MTKVTITLEPNNTVSGSWVGEPKTTSDAALRDLCKTHISESLNDYRFFGNLRAAIAWLPAAVTFALIAYAVDLVEEPNLTLLGGLVALQGITLALILATQWFLQVRQRDARWAATVAQENYMQEKPGPLPSFYELTRVRARERAKKNADGSDRKRGRRWRADKPTYALILFFLALMAGQIFVIRAKVPACPNESMPWSWLCGGSKSADPDTDKTGGNSNSQNPPSNSQNPTPDNATEQPAKTGGG